MTRSFAQKLRAGVTREELKKYYCMSDDQFSRTISSLQEIRNNGRKHDL